MSILTSGWTTSGPAGATEIFHSSYAEGRVVYMCGDLDRSFWEFLTPDHGKVLANSVLWAMRGAFREIYPVRGIELRLRLEGIPAGRARALKAGSAVEIGRDGERATIAVPEVAVHEATVIEMELPSAPG